MAPSKYISIAKSHGFDLKEKLKEDGHNGFAFSYKSCVITIFILESSYSINVVNKASCLNDDYALLEDLDIDREVEFDTLIKYLKAYINAKQAEIKAFVALKTLSN